MTILIIIGLFHFKEYLGKYFWIGYLIVMPALVYAVSVAFSLQSQLQSCGSMNIKLATAGSTYMLAYLYGAIAITQSAAVRAPVVSVIPYMTMKGIDSVLEIERGLPVIQGIAVCYYVIFAIILGQMSSIGYSAVCSSLR